MEAGRRLLVPDVLPRIIHEVDKAATDANLHFCHLPIRIVFQGPGQGKRYTQVGRPDASVGSHDLRLLKAALVSSGARRHLLKTRRDGPVPLDGWWQSAWEAQRDGLHPYPFERVQEPMQRNLPRGPALPRSRSLRPQPGARGSEVRRQAETRQRQPPSRRLLPPCSRPRPLGQAARQASAGPTSRPPRLPRLTRTWVAPLLARTCRAASSTSGSDWGSAPTSSPSSSRLGFRSHGRPPSATASSASLRVSTTVRMERERAASSKRSRKGPPRGGGQWPEMTSVLQEPRSSRTRWYRTSRSLGECGFDDSTTCTSSASLLTVAFTRTLPAASITSPGKPSLRIRSSSRRAPAPPPRARAHASWPRSRTPRATLIPFPAANQRRLRAGTRVREAAAWARLPSTSYTRSIPGARVTVRIMLCFFPISASSDRGTKSTHMYGVEAYPPPAPTMVPGFSAPAHLPAGTAETPRSRPRRRAHVPR